MIERAIAKNICANEKLGQAAAKLVIKATTTLIQPEAEIIQQEYQELCQSLVCQKELLIAIIE